MKKKHYDNWECSHAFSLIKKDPEQARICYEEYIKKYPKDYRAYPFYNYVLIILGEAELAQEVLNNLKDMFFTDKYFQLDHKKMLIVRRNLYLNQLRIYAYEARYKDILDYYKKHEVELINDPLKSVLYYCEKQLGIITKEREEKAKSYYYKQIIDYQEERFLEHIKGHISKFNLDDEELEKTIFSDDFPISRIIEEVKKYIPSNKALATGFFEDKYVFKYDYCGRVDNKIQNYFTVLCFRKNNNLITMYPSVDSELLPAIDLNYLKSNISNSKVKVKSQIEKFNNRYRNN